MLRQPLNRPEASRDGSPVAWPDRNQLMAYIDALKTFIRLGVDLGSFPSTFPVVKRAAEDLFLARQRFRINPEWRSDRSLREFVVGFDQSVEVIDSVMERAGLNLLNVTRNHILLTAWSDIRSRVTYLRFLKLGRRDARRFVGWKLVFDPSEAIRQFVEGDRTPFLKADEINLLRRCVQKMRTGLRRDELRARPQEERPNRERPSATMSDERGEEVRQENRDSGRQDDLKATSEPSRSAPASLSSQKERPRKAPGREGHSAAEGKRPKPQRKRDGSQELKVLKYLEMYLQVSSDAKKSGDSQFPLPSQKAIAKLLEVSESMVSRVMKPWMEEHQSELQAEVLSGYKHRGKIEAIFKDETDS